MPHPLPSLLAITYPVTFQLAGASIPAHLVFELLAFQVAAVVYYSISRGRQDAIADRTRVVLILAAGLGALAGSRALAWLEHWEVLFAAPSWFTFYNTKTIVGAILGATLAIELAKKCVGETRSTGDLYVFPLIAGIIVGRIGCFLTGVADHTAGLPTVLPWAMEQGDGVLRHPTALYEILFLMLLAVALRLNEARLRRRNGLMFLTFLSAYLSFRLGVDFLKPGPTVFLDLSAIQWACVVALLGYCLPRFNHLLSCNEVTPITT